MTANEALLPAEWQRDDEPQPGEHEAYVYHVLLDDDARRHMHEPQFPTLQLFRDEEEPCKQ